MSDTWPPADDKILKYIHGPEDLKKVPVDRLPALAQEVRDRIVEVAYKNGGHFGANLGAVELAIAMHYVFDCLQDGVIWDVGHQCYPHKILTGRNDSFDTMRQQGGLMGFPNPTESPYDLFCTGHAGASISSAWGMTLGHQVLGRDNKVVPIIGDASIVSGMAFEALNHIGHLKKNMLVILNDNEMSISETVGAFKTTLNRVRLGNLYKEVKNDLKYILEKVPLGESVRKSISYVQDCVRHMFVPGQFFEDLGFRYYGPIDGHDLPLLIETLSQLKDIQGPILLHVKTVKGKGYEEAEKDQRTYHAVKPKKSGAAPSAAPAKPANKAWTKIFAEEMIELANRDPRVCAITAAMADGTGLAEFTAAHPERGFDVGICEQHGVGLAAGLAKAGARPVAAIYSTFLQRGYDQVHQEVCLQNLPVIFAMDRGGVVGDDGPTHHGVFDIAYLRALPNIALCAPKDEAEFRAMLGFCVDYTDGPIGIRYARGNAPDPIAPCAPIELGKGETLVKGADVAILAYGVCVEYAMDAAKRLAEQDIYATVFNARFARPLDEAILELCAAHKVVITVEDHNRAGGFGAAVLELLNDHGAESRHVRRLSHPDRYSEHASIPYLHKLSGIDADGIVRTALDACREETRARRQSQPA